MRIALSTVQVPFVYGGAEILAEQLINKLKEWGHEAQMVSIPFKWYPPKAIIDSMIMGRLIDLTDAAYQKIDLMIGLKFPAYYATHPNKVLWLVHQHRQAYDLYKTKFGDLHQTADGREVRDSIINADSQILAQYHRRYTISENVSQRLKKYNNLESESLYAPPMDYEKFFCESYEPYIFYPSRIDAMKRQHLLVEAARHMTSELKIKIAGTGDPSEVDRLKKMIHEFKLEDKVELLGRVSQTEKIHLLANCRGVFFGCYDEDLGYVSMEALFSSKPLIVFTDAGCPLEFVRNGETGFIVEQNPKLLAKKLDELGEDRNRAEKMGQLGRELLRTKNVSWDFTIKNLLG